MPQHGIIREHGSIQELQFGSVRAPGCGGIYRKLERWADPESSRA